MTDIETQLRHANPAERPRRCPLCVASNPKIAKFDELRKRMENWITRLDTHESGEDSLHTMRSIHDEYAEMVYNSQLDRDHQMTDADRKDVVVYNSMSYASFAEHFTKPHNPTRESRNTEKNDAIEALYATHLQLTGKYAKLVNNSDNPDDFKKYSQLIRDMKTVNDISISPRFLSFHSIRKNIIK